MFGVSVLFQRESIFLWDLLLLLTLTFSPAAQYTFRYLIYLFLFFC